jgi:hypothetical protein
VDRPQSLTGNVGNPVITLQLTTYGTSYTSVKNIARAVRLAVDNWTGTTASVTIQRTTLTSEADGVEHCRRTTRCCRTTRCSSRLSFASTRRPNGTPGDQL